MITKTKNRTRLAMSGVTYDFDFRIDAETELEVYGIDSDDVATELTTGFSIAFSAEDEEGTVTFDAEPTDYDYILMLRAKEYTQPTDIPIRGGFSEEDIEQALDNIVMQVQQLKEITDYCVKLSSTAEPLTITLPAPVDGKALLWDGVTGALKNSETDVDDIATAVTAAEAAQTAAEAAQTAAELAETNAEAAAENFEFASKAEAEAGTNETKSMNPLRTAQSIAALQRAIASKADAEAGTDNTKDMTPLRVAEAIAALGSTAAWVDYSATSTVVGFSAFSVKKIRYCKIGNLVVCLFHINGTSDATSLTFTLPNQAKNISPYARCGYGYDNSSAYKHNATAYIDIDSATVIVIAENGASNWTNANNKVVYGQIIYETA